MWLRLRSNSRAEIVWPSTVVKSDMANHMLAELYRWGFYDTQIFRQGKSRMNISPQWIFHMRRLARVGISRKCSLGCLFMLGGIIFSVLFFVFDISLHAFVSVRNFFLLLLNRKFMAVFICYKFASNLWQLF